MSNAINNTPFQKRLGEQLHAVLRELEKRGEPTPAFELFASVASSLKLSEEEKERHQNGSPRWETNVRWHSVDAVKAGFLEKSGGKWSLTDAGKHALKKTSDQFIYEIRQKYKEWNEQRNDKANTEKAPQTSIQRDEQRQSTYESAFENARLEIENHIWSIEPYDMQFAVRDLLIAMGYHVRYVATPGKDGGIDLIAFQNPLGSDATRLVVQVKHRPSQKASSKEVRELEGVLRKIGDVGLFVSTGDFADGVEKEYRLSSAKHIDTMNMDRFIDLWQKYYDKLPQTGKARIPLTKVYFLSPVLEGADDGE